MRGRLAVGDVAQGVAQRRQLVNFLIDLVRLAMQDIARQVRSSVCAKHSSDFLKRETGRLAHGDQLELQENLRRKLPPEAVALFQPHIGAIVEAIFRAVSTATAATFVPGIVSGVLAAGLVLLLRDPSNRTVTVEHAHPAFG